MTPIETLESLIEKRLKNTCRHQGFNLLSDDEVSTLMEEAHALGRLSALSEAERAVRTFLEGQSQKTYDLTLKGKNSPMEVSDEDFQRSSFSFDDIYAVIRSLQSKP